MQELKILQGAEEFSIGSGPTGVLLVHGFTGCPQSMRGLGDYLADRGLGVTAVRLPGHGTTWEDLGSRTATEWVETVEAALDKLLTEHEEVFLVGLSFGAALILDVAARRPHDVAGVVTLAGFVHTNDPRRFLAPVIRLLTKSLPGVGNDICDPDQREIAYDRVPTAATYSMLRYIKGVRDELPSVNCPLLVMHSHNDHTVHPGNATIIYDGVSSKDKSIVWFDRSYHVITLDYDREEVFRRTAEFIEQRASQRRGQPGAL